MPNSTTQLRTCSKASSSGRQAGWLLPESAALIEGACEAPIPATSSAIACPVREDRERRHPLALLVEESRHLLGRLAAEAGADFRERQTDDATEVAEDVHAHAGSDQTWPI